MKLKAGERTFEAQFEYVPFDERVVLRTDLAFLSPEDTRRLKLELAESSPFELDLLSAAGYMWLTRRRGIRS